MSLFYDCNECKEKEYVKENVIRASNQLEQQAIVDQQIAESLGLDIQASTLSKLAKRIINNLGSELVPTDIKVVETAKQKLPTDYLLQAIQSGKLSQLIDRIKTVDPKKLSKKAKLIQSDLKSDQMVKDVLNEEIAKILDDITITPEEKPVAIKKAIIDIAAGKDGKVIDELVKATLETAISKSDTKKIVALIKEAPTKEDVQRVANEFSEKYNFTFDKKYVSSEAIDRYKKGLLSELKNKIADVTMRGIIPSN